jgi:hypothetical protein
MIGNECHQKVLEKLLIRVLVAGKLDAKEDRLEAVAGERHVEAEEVAGEDEAG